MRRSIAWRGDDMRAAVPVHLDVSGIGAVGAVEQPDELGPARAEEAGDAHDLAGEDVDVDRLEYAPRARSPLARSTGVARAVDLTLGDGRQRRELVELAADHLRDELGAGEVRRRGTRR